MAPPPTKKLKPEDDKSEVLLSAIKDASFVRILVGTNRKPFHVYEKLAAHYSSYFQGMLAGPCIEAQSKEVVWEDEDPETVTYFIAWLYFQEVDLPRYTASASNVSIPEHCGRKGEAEPGGYRALFNCGASQIAAGLRS